MLSTKQDNRLNSLSFNEKGDGLSIIVKIGVFTLLVTGLAWIATMLGGNPDEPGLGLLVWGVAPIGSALVLRLVTRDWHDFGLKLAFRTNRNWYVLSLLLYPIIILVIVGLGLLFGITSLEDFSWSAYLQALLPASIIYLVFAIFEEFGWRGYLAPKFAKLKLNKLVGHLSVGIIWASWHLPFIATFAGYTNESLAGFIPRYFLGIMASAIVYGEIRLRTESVWPAVLLHWIGNTIATPLLAFSNFKQGTAYLGFYGSSGLGIITLLTALGLYLYWRRERYERTHASAKHASLEGA